jgi:hypothetical protein
MSARVDRSTFESRSRAGACDPENSVLGSEILDLKQHFLIDHPVMYARDGHWQFFSQSGSSQSLIQKTFQSF